MKTPLKSNTHHETVLSRRVGGVYMNSRRLPTDLAMRMHNAAVGRDPGHTDDTTKLSPTTVVANSCSHRRRDATRQFRLVGVGGVYWA